MNTGSIPGYAPFTGNDADVEKAWLQGVTGCNTIITVVDEGIMFYGVEKYDLIIIHIPSFTHSLITLSLRFGLYTF